MIKRFQKKRIWDSNRTFIMGYLILLPSPYVFDMFNYVPYGNESLIGHYIGGILGFIFFSSIFIIISGAMVEGESMDIENRRHTFREILPIYLWSFLKCTFFCIFLLVCAQNSPCIKYEVVSCFFDNSHLYNLEDMREDLNYYDFFLGLYNLYILFLYQALELHTYIFYKNKLV